MGFHNGVMGKYEKLTSTEEKLERPKRRWAMKMNGKGKGFRLSIRPKRLTWKAFSMVLFPRKIAEIYDEIIKRMNVDDICPGIVFCGQWGFPFLSHSNAKSNMSYYYY